ncbi:RDD family protein [Photobacterium sanctipauli]|nr:RDD family protein [Photobacterium sanctipauli]
MEKVEEKCTAVFWQRIVALFVDGLILGSVGYFIGALFEETLVNMGDWARLIGFVISITYFGIMNSNLYKGQTLGKKLLKIRVVDEHNEPITPVRSFIRNVVFSMPFYLNGTSLNYQGQFGLLMYPLSVLIFGGLISIAYLFLFNRSTRQTLHDLLVGTYVVKEASSHPVTGAVWKPHLYIVGCILLVSLVAPYFIAKSNVNNDYSELVAVSKKLKELKNVNDSNVTVGEYNFHGVDGRSKTTTYVNIQAVLNSNNVDDVIVAQELGEIVISNYHHSTSKQVVNVTLVYGYNLGIWSMWSSYTHQFKPLDLMRIE